MHRFNKRMKILTIHSLVRCTGKWRNFDEVLKVNKNSLAKNQYPEGWSSQLVNETLRKNLPQPKQLNKLVAQNTSKVSLKKKNIEIPSLFLQYRGNHSLGLTEKLNKASEESVIFTKPANSRHAYKH